MPSAILLRSIEYSFSLADALPMPETLKLPPQATFYRMLDMPSIEANYSIAILISDTKGDLDLALEQNRQSVEQQRRITAWYWEVQNAMEQNILPPAQLPDTYQLHRERTSLSSTQIAWFQNEIDNLSPYQFTDCGDQDAYERDGSHKRGQILKSGETPHTFTVWEPTSSKCELQTRYFAILYQLAASSLTDETSLSFLVKLQSSFFGIPIHKTSFAFPLIK